jgi:hypothetical protein
MDFESAKCLINLILILILLLLWANKKVHHQPKKTKKENLPK